MSDTMRERLQDAFTEWLGNQSGGFTNLLDALTSAAGATPPEPVEDERTRRAKELHDVMWPGATWWASGSVEARFLAGADLSIAREREAEVRGWNAACDAAVAGPLEDEGMNAQAVRTRMAVRALSRSRAEARSK